MVLLSSVSRFFLSHRTTVWLRILSRIMIYHLCRITSNNIKNSGIQIIYRIMASKYIQAILYYSLDWIEMYAMIDQTIKNIYYIIKLQCPFVCVCVCLSVPPFLTRPSDRNQIWHTYSDRYGTHSQLKQTLLTPPQGGLRGF